MSVSPCCSPSPRASDLTSTLAKYLDKHMVLPLLDFLQEKKLYDSKEILASKIQLAACTKMVDFHGGEYKALHGSDPVDLESRRNQVYGELQSTQSAVGPLLTLLNDDNHEADDIINAGNFNIEYLNATYGVTQDNIDNLYTFAKLNFDCGRYRDSADYLFYYRLLCKFDEEKNFQSLWGKLASEILMVNGEAAMNDLNALKDAIDQRIHVPAYIQLEQRSWLVHWSLFVFFNIPDGRVKMIDFFLGDSRLLNAIQTSCPHILRYLTCAVIINRKRKNMLKDLTRVLMIEKSNYSDPLTSFLLTVYQEFDFKLAHKYLQQCEVLLTNDFFLGYSAEEFMEHARLLLFEAYCRIHKCIHIDTLSECLDLHDVNVFPSADYKERKALADAYANEVLSAQQQGLPVPPQPAALSEPLPTPEQKGLSKDAVIESKIVELIRICRVDAKIDAKNRQIVMAASSPSIYQQIIDKTKSVVYRSQQLAITVQTKWTAKLEQERD